MNDHTSSIKAIGFVKSTRTEPIDDYWGGLISTIELDENQFDENATLGLDSFSHIEVVYAFHKVNPESIVVGAEHPRERQDWPKVGIFAQRKKSRPNRLAVSVCKLIKVEGLTITIEALDAIDESPVIDIKPYIKEFAPKDSIQPSWASELMQNYFAKPEKSSSTQLETKSRPDFVKHYSEIQEPDNSCYKTSNSSELLSIGSPFGRTFGFKRLGIHHELLLPGRRTSWPHAEKTEEEFAYVIEGSPDVWIDGNLYPLGPGDGVGFAPGTGIAHTFINNTENPVRFLVVGDTNRDDNKCHYPLHPERNKLIGDFWWNDVPSRKLGDHDGLPDALR